ncbi:MAG: MopE-related protein [Kofleriaceae bacterium]
MRRCAVLALLVAGCATGSGADPDAPGADAPPTVDATPPADGCVPSAERCDGADDDCDGEIDEDFGTLDAPCEVGVGACAREGRWACAADGADVVCDATAGEPGTETCDGADDDCDGFTDEGFAVGSSCDGADADLCAEGLIACAGGVAVCTDDTGDDVETCNDVDDDCDLAVDEGFALGAACDGPDGDACAEGMIVCAADGTATCDDTTGTSVETCNGLDDDCLGGIDDPWPTLGDDCVVGIGACARTGAWVCDGAGTGVACDAVAGAASPGDLRRRRRLRLRRRRRPVPLQRSARGLPSTSPPAASSSPICRPPTTPRPTVAPAVVASAGATCSTASRCRRPR